jgi:tetratricopeptide (TPR) repeat protein
MVLSYFVQNSVKTILLMGALFFTGCSSNPASLRIPFTEIEKAVVTETSKVSAEGTKLSIPQSEEEWEARLFEISGEETEVKPTLDNKTVISQKYRIRAVNPAAQSLSLIAAEAFNQGDWDRAKSTLERAIKIEPDNGFFWRQLSYTHLRAGNYKQALAHAQRSLLLSDYTNNGRDLSSALLDVIIMKMAGRP